MTRFIESSQAIGNPHELAHNQEDVGLGAIPVGDSLVMLASDYDVVITNLPKDAVIEHGETTMAATPVHALLGNVFLHGIGAPVMSDTGDSYLQTEWFTSLPAVNRVADACEISPGGWRLSHARNKADYTARQRYSHLFDSGSMQIPSFVAADLVASRMSGIIVGTILMPPGFISALRTNSRLLDGRSGHLKHHFLKDLNTAVSSYGRAIGMIPIDVQADLEQELETVFYDRSELVAGDRDKIEKLFIPEGRNGWLHTIMPQIVDVLNDAKEKLTRAQDRI